MDQEGEEVKDPWLSLDDISLLQQSFLDNFNESSLLGPQSGGLDDLSCSLIHCTGLEGEGDHDHDANATAALFDVERFCGEVMKRDKIISALFRTLTTVVKHREDGDNKLSSVEKQMAFLHGELEKCRGLNSTYGADGDKKDTTLLSRKELKENKPESSPVVPLSNADTETQTDPPSQDGILKDVVIPVHKAVQCTLKDSDNETVRNIHELSEKQVSSDIIVKISSQTQTYNEFEQERHCEIIEKHGHTSTEHHNKSFDSDDFNIDLHGSPNPLAIQPTKDMFRLTFSPSICEYEAEAHSGCKRSDQDLAAVEDLKLQFNDTERKFEATKKYLEEMTTEREQEREDFQRTINDLVIRCEEFKKDKDKMEVIVSQQKVEIEDMAESLRNCNLTRVDVLQKSLSAEDELKHAVEKICELRDIIRALEEQVEETTRQATLYSDGRKGIAEESLAEEFSKNSCTEQFRPVDDGGASELDITVELQAQVQDLAKRIEEKLIELENFSWQTRPGSSCSVKSGDDVSVRAADRAHFNDDNDTSDHDLISQVFCGLRRLECSFDTLVRFEEVLLKKIKDADLKISIDNKRLEDITRENCRLRQDLGLCRQKILDFENFMSETKKSNSETSTPRAEALRTDGYGFAQRFEESSPGIKRVHFKGQMEMDQPSEDMADIDRDGEPFDENDLYGYDENETSTNPNGDEGMMDNDRNLPTGNGAEESNENSSSTNGGHADAPLDGKKNGNGSGPNGKAGGANSQGNGSKPTPGADGKLGTGSGPNSRSKGLVLETSLDGSNRRGSNPNDKSGSGPGKNGVDDKSGPGSGKNGADNKSGPGSGRNGSDDNGRNKDPNASNASDSMGNPSNLDEDDDDDVLTYDVTTVSDFEVDGDKLKYIGSKILPPEDPNKQAEDQLNRLEGTDAKVELEKLKTKLDQLQKALEAEQQRTQDLAQQLDEVINGPQDPNDGYLSREPGDDEADSLEEYADDLERTLEEKERVECKLRKNLDCATMAYQQLKVENEQLRGYVDQLESELEFYTSNLEPTP